MGLLPAAADASESGMPLDDHELLAEWSHSRYERALRTLVDRRLPLVFGTASRICRHPEQAWRVAEGAFVQLASQAPRLAAGQSLSGWLHAATRAVAEAAEVSEDTSSTEPSAEAHGVLQEPPADWSQMAPVIDELIAALPAVDREALMLRLVEGDSLEEVGRRLGVTEPAARQRVGRALDKLRQLLDGRGVTTSVAALATLLPSHVMLTPPSEWAAAIVNTALDAPAAPSSSSNTTLVLKRGAVAVAAVVLVGIVADQQASIGALKEELASMAPATAEGVRRTASAHSAAAREVSATAPAGLAARALALARTADPLARDAALAEWSARFITTAEILPVLAALRADPHATPALRAAIAPHLTRQWAAIDAPACIASLLKDAALYHRDPFASNNNPLAGGEAAGINRVGLFRLVAATNPTAFAAWLKDTPVDLIPALLGERQSPTFTAWALDEGLDDAALAQLERQRAAEPPAGEGLLSGDFAEVLTRAAPELWLRPALEGQELAVAHRYYSALVARFGADEVFAAALLGRLTHSNLWEIFGRAEGGYQPQVADGFVKLARADLAVRKHNLAQATATAVALPAGLRQAATLTALLDSLKPGDAGYWDGLAIVANAIDATTAGADTVTGACEVVLYTALRTRLAVKVAKNDIEGALAWAALVRNESVRTACLAAIAAQELRPDIRAWTAAAEDDPSVTVVRCEGLVGGSSSAVLLCEFELPPEPEETVPQAYARIRSALAENLRKAGFQTHEPAAVAVAPVAPAPEALPVAEEPEDPDLAPELQPDQAPQPEQAPDDDPADDIEP